MQLAAVGAVAMDEVVAAVIARSRVRHAGKAHRVHLVVFFLAGNPSW